MAKKKDTEELSDEERELFRYAFFHGVIKRAPPVQKIAPKNESSVGDSDDNDLFLRAMKSGVDAALKKDKFVVDDAVERLGNKKRKLIDAVIDLHGMYAEDAVSALLHFIDRELNRGSKTILVIHGKGMGILKNAVTSIIDTHPNVSDYQIPAPKHGGRGALLVRLRRRAS